ncbi:MAG: flagellar M-ring protein FliF [Sedimentisphaerales bacterium]|nr:flagellar M-ring protein FliF [Sedimentisphaerales bacterium]
MSFLEKIAAIWKNINIVQKALLAAIILTMIAAGGLLMHWASRPDMRLLYSDLAPEEASKIVDKIAEKNIAYELKNGGTTIYAPKEHIYQLRLDMAKEGLPEGSQKGYRIFDDTKIGVSPKIQDINLQRALQEELAKSIQMIDGVVHARIHIVTPEHSIFQSEDKQTTASVAIRLRPGFELSQASVAAITHLVAGAVEGLSPEKVTVVDSKGKLLSRQTDEMLDNGADSVADYRERVEHNLSRKAEDMLTAVLGPGKASVKVSAEIDMTSLSTVTEKYEPKGVPTKEEITSTSEKQPGEGEQNTTQGEKAEESIVTEYSIGKTVEQKTIIPGEIKKLTVAAFVDLTPDNADPNNPASAEPVMAVTDIEQIIKNALGLKDSDSLKVVHARFNRPAKFIPEKEEASSWPRYMAITKNSSLGIMAICALLVFRMLAVAGKKAAAAQSAGELPEGSLALPQLSAAQEGAEPVILRRQIASALQNNPAQVKRLFTSWAEEKE